MTAYEIAGWLIGQNYVWHSNGFVISPHSPNPVTIESAVLTCIARQVEALIGPQGLYGGLYGIPPTGGAKPRE